MIVSSRIKTAILQQLKKYRKPIFFFVLAALILPEITVYFNPNNNRGRDILGYIAAGHDALKLGELYKFSETNTWPPFFSFFSVPLALCNDLLGLVPTKLLWYFVNFTAFVLSMKIMMLMLCKKKPAFFPGNGFDFTSDLIVVPFLLVLPPFIATFYWLQINMIILLLITSGLYFHDHQKDWKAGFFFGLAASIKAYPGLFLIYFLLRKQWKTSISTLLWSIAFTVSPVLFYGFNKFIALMNEWISMSLLKPLGPDFVTPYNQSLYAFWERLLVHQLHIVETAPSIFVTIANYCSIALIAIISFSTILRVPHKRASVSGLIEFSIICIMMILFPPIAWRHYWALLLPATVSIYYCFRTFPGIITPLVRYLLAVHTFLIWIAYILSSVIGEFSKIYSFYTISALALLAILLILHKNYSLQQSNS